MACFTYYTTHSKPLYRYSHGRFTFEMRGTSGDWVRCFPSERSVRAMTQISAAEAGEPEPREFAYLSDGGEGAIWRTGPGTDGGFEVKNPIDGTWRRFFPSEGEFIRLHEISVVEAGEGFDRGELEREVGVLLEAVDRGEDITEAHEALVGRLAEADDIFPEEARHQIGMVATRLKGLPVMCGTL